MTDHSLFPILGKLNRLTWRTDNPDLGECQCPAHEDSTNSLHTTLKACDDGQTRLMLKCHAGCSNADILKALGEGFSSLFPDRSRAPKPSSSSAGKKGAGEPKLVKVYDYHDADGNVLHQTLRWEPKNFTQRRRAEPNQIYQIDGKEYRSFKDPHGNWWINTLKGIEPVIYRLPEILKADPRKIIFLCEGEKDADNLQKAFGVYATTVPMGAGKWRASYTATFRGRRVVVVPDTDKPRKGQLDPAANAGFDGARRVASELVKVCLETRICYPENLFNLTPKWDLSDWLAAGGTKQQFIEACNSADVLTAGHPGLIPAGMTADVMEQNLSSTMTDALQQIAPELPEFGPISNYVEKPAKADGNPVLDPLPMRSIARWIISRCKGFPKRVGRALFVEDDDQKIEWLEKSDQLFAFIGRRIGTPAIVKECPGFHSKAEIFQGLKTLAECFDGIETSPHYPPIAGRYYAHPPLPVSTGKFLKSLFDRFAYHSRLDRDLAESFLLTLVWGGPAGQRPMFVISGQGQGSGKTIFVSLLSKIVGGEIQFGAKFDFEIATKKLLNGGSLEKRICTIDNLKSSRYSHAELESLITKSEISGWRNYVGEMSRDNLLTWVLTVNAPELGRDLATRTISIRLGSPVYSTTWYQETENFIRKHRWEILSDAIEILKNPESEVLGISRWGEWAGGVLSKLPEPSECQAVIMERQLELDADTSEGGDFETDVAEYLKRLSYDATCDKVFIPSSILADWSFRITGEKTTPKSIKLMVKRGNENKTLKRLVVGSGRTGSARGVFWIGSECLPSSTPYTDLKKVWFNYLERKEQQKLQSNVLAANGVAKSTNNENDDDDDFEFSFKSDQR